MEMTQAEFARHRGISKQVINKKVKSGILPRKENGKLDQEECDRILDGNHIVRGENVVEDNEGDNLSYAEQRTLLTKYRAQLAKMELESKSNKLIPIEDVYDVAFKSSRKLRDGLQNFSDRLSGQLASETDALKVNKLLRDEIRYLLSEYIETIQSLFSNFTLDSRLDLTESSTAIGACR